MKEWSKSQSPEYKQTDMNHLCESETKMSTVQLGKGAQ